MKLKKIKFLRQSGLPVDMSEFDEFEKEWKDRYDKMMKELSGNMPLFSQKLDELETELKGKYTIQKEVEVPRYAKGWKSLIEEFGFGIMLGTDTETGDLVAIIMDQGI